MKTMKQTVMAIGGSVVLAGTLVWAASSLPVTLVTDSGERIAGELIDMTGSGFVLMVNGEERTYPIDGVTVVDFVGGGHGLPETEGSQVRPGEHLIILKGSQSFHGRLFDVTGDPLTIVFKVGGADRAFAAADVGRIYLERIDGPAGVITEAVDPAPEMDMEADNDPLTIGVSARTAWTRTALQVERGTRLSFATTGEIVLSADPADVAGPAGSKTQRKVVAAPIPTALAGALIARIGTGQPFAIGDQSGLITMPAKGTLFLGINDDVFDDNQGQFHVVVTWHQQRVTQ